MKKPIVFLILMLVIIAISGCIGQATPIEQPKTEQQPLATNEQLIELKEFNITAKQFGFEPDIITVNKGNAVKLKITSIDVTHGFSINEYNIRETLEPGKTITVEFVADKSGTFQFFCSVYCGIKHAEMRGKLIVK